MGVTLFNSKGKMRYLLAVVLLCFVELSISGIIAGFTSKPSYVKPEILTAKQIVNPKNYLPIDTLTSVGITVLSNNLDDDTDLSLDHIELYEKKGTVLLLFKNNPWTVQLEGYSGKVLSIEKLKRNTTSSIHAARWVDSALGTKGIFSRIYTTAMGLIVLFFSLFGLWALFFSSKKES